VHLSTFVVLVLEGLAQCVQNSFHHVFRGRDVFRAIDDHPD
jgi:hypothetical protein